MLRAWRAGSLLYRSGACTSDLAPGPVRSSVELLRPGLSQVTPNACLGFGSKSSGLSSDAPTSSRDARNTAS